MEIKETLEGLIDKVQGGIASVLISSDGEAIEYCSRDKAFDIEWIGARYGLVFRDLSSTVERLGQGLIRSIVVELEKGNLVVNPIIDQFYLILFLHPEGNLGQGLHYSKMAAVAIERELAS